MIDVEKLGLIIVALIASNVLLWVAVAAMVLS